MSTVSIDQQFVEFVVKSIVGNPDAVSVVRSVDEKGVLLELTVDPEDLGRVIGKRGATAQSIRTLLRALGTKNDARYNLKIVDNGVPRPPRGEDDQMASRADDDTQASSSPSDKDDTATPEVVADVPAEKPRESKAVSQTRKELDDLDDLDI